MAKSLRSKIKRKFRTELRQRIGVPHMKVQEAKIQENLKRAIESQVQGKSLLGLKAIMGSTTTPISTINPNDIDMNTTIQDTTVTETKATVKKKKNIKKKKKFVHFHVLRKKGV